MTRSDEEPIAGLEPSKLTKIKPHEVLIRFGFGAAISLVSGTVSLVFGPKAGGLFLAFPAILPATLTLIEKKEGTDAAVHDVEGAVFGALGLVCFALVATATLPSMRVGIALSAAFVVWAVVSVGAYLLYHAIFRPG
ncbi:MAG: DUF3147 family protein [Actinobacteria bacterium]|nr:DUF3147 family protein [Actinomycetota bacterium]